MVLRKRFYEVDKSQQFPLYLFVRGEPYKLMGLIPGSIRLFGTDSRGQHAMPMPLSLGPTG